MKGFIKAYWNHQTLYDHFKEFGNILSAKVSIDQHYVSKGYGFVQFEKAEEAKAALEKVNLTLT